MKRPSWYLRQLFLAPVYLYKGVLSPFFGPSCHYHPSCSTYMIGAVNAHGVVKGFIMGMARILRCSRWYMGGDDPIPEVWSWQAIKDGYTLFRRR
jgi:putative membrane protein insertion efficiency factor